MEKLLRVSAASAIRWLHDFGTYEAGRTFLTGREEMIADWRAFGGRTFGHEDRTLRDLRGCQVELAVTDEPGQGFPAPAVPEVQFASGGELPGENG